MKIYLIIIICLIICDGNNYALKKKQSGKKMISFFRSTGYYNSFYLKINDDFHYQERNERKGRGVFGFLITKYPTSCDSLHIFLKINNKDTSFYYNVAKYDSLMIGLNEEYHFFCLNEKQYIWAEE